VRTTLAEMRVLAGLSAPLEETAADTIDQGWIDGIRGGWEQTLSAAHPMRLLDVPEEDRVAKAVDALGHLNLFVDNLREDLLITKALWQRPQRGMTRGEQSREDAARVGKLLASISRSLNAGVVEIKASKLFHGMENQSYIEALQGAERKMDELLGHLEDMLERHGDDWDPETGTETGENRLRWASWHADTPEGRSTVPNQVALGRVKVIFRDTPMDPTQIRGTEYRGVTGHRTPMKRELFIRQLDQARKFLRRHKLEKQLWYGPIFIVASETSGGFGEESTGATYVRAKDVVRILADPDDPELETHNTAANVVHELGHRYWFKFLSPEDRHNFRRFFGKVAAATKYGGSRPREDFAELFAAYVLGPQWAHTGWSRVVLTRAQRQRMEAFLGRKRRLEDRMNLTHLKVLAGVKRVTGLTEAPETPLAEEWPEGKYMSTSGSYEPTVKTYQEAKATLDKAVRLLEKAEDAFDSVYMSEFAIFSPELERRYKFSRFVSRIGDVVRIVEDLKDYGIRPKRRPR
jgi:hypothetical protein